MSSTFSVADKLALMLTSAGSQRKLAAYLGVSHQQVGRWVKGASVHALTGEVTNEPRSAVVRTNIDAAFSQYRKAVQRQAWTDGIPYTPAAPVNFKRLGAPGLRVLAENTDALSPDLLARAIEEQSATGLYHEVSVRSMVNLRVYFQRGEEAHAAQRSRGGRVAERMIAARAGLLNKLHDGVEVVPMWTKKENATPMVSPEIVANRVRAKLRQRHEPATGQAGTVLADQILFSLRTQHASQQAKRKATARKRKKAR